MYGVVRLRRDAHERYPLTPLGQARLASRVDRLGDEVVPRIRERLRVCPGDPALQEIARTIDHLERLALNLPRTQDTVARSVRA